MTVASTPGGAPATPPAVPAASAAAPSVAPAVPAAPPSPVPGQTPEAARIAALEGQLAAVETALLAEVPAHLKGLVPVGLPVADRIGWLHQAKTAGLFVAAVVPTTDTGKPAVTPRTEDLSKLPTFARMARGYQTK